MLLKHPIDIDFVEKYWISVIVKKISGSYGRGVFLCENKKQLNQLVDESGTNQKIL